MSGDKELYRSATSLTGLFIKGLDTARPGDSFLSKPEFKPTFTYKFEELTFFNASGRILTLFSGDLLMPLVLPTTSLSERIDVGPSLFVFNFLF